MAYLEDNLPSLHELVTHRVSALNDKQKKSVSTAIARFIKKPSVDDYKLSVIANKMIAINTDYDDYVSVSIFKQLPDFYTLKMLAELEEKLYLFIKANILGSPLDKNFTSILIKETMHKFPDLNLAHAKQKALGNWGWLLPHALMHIIIDYVNDIINRALLEDKKTHRKGRIRIKKIK